MVELLIALGIGYLAYRAFRGGFRRPQSERLTGYGVVGIIVLLLVVLALFQIIDVYFKMKP